MYGGPLHKDLGTIAYTTPSEKSSSGEYYLPVDVGENVEVTLKLIQQVSDNVKSGELSISISTKYYIK